MAIVRILEIAVGIGLLIAVHELGHFLAAKWAGVRVDAFALGMGPKLIGFRRGETEYSLRVIPIGGFCAMAGEEPGAKTEAPRERQFRHQPPGKKCVILLAGVFMNFVLSVVLFSIVFGIGIEFIRPVIGMVVADGAAARAGLLPGDEVLSINGKEDVDFKDVQIEILMGDLEDDVHLTVDRSGETHEFTLKPTKSKENGLPEIGIAPATGRKVIEVEKDCAAAEAGLRKGDVIDTVDGRVFWYWPDAVFYMSSRIGEPVAVKVTRDGRSLSLNLIPRSAKLGTIGITPKRSPVVAEVMEGSSAEREGIKKGDEILAIDGTRVFYFDDMVRLSGPRVGEQLVYTIRRGDNEPFDVTLTPEASPGGYSGLVGIRREPKSDFTVGAVETGSAAEAAGVKAGDVLTAVGGKSLKDKDWGLFRAALSAAATSKNEKDREITLEWRSGKMQFEKKVTVKAVDHPLRAHTGIAVMSGIMRIRKYAPWVAPVVGLKKSWGFVQQIYLFVRGVVTNRISPKVASGPVGIAHFSYKIASQGLPEFLFWLAFLGVNLAVVNLLPIPPLDGGLLILTGVEKIRGKAVSDKVLIGLQLAGWAFVIVLLVLVTWNDIMRLIA